MNPTDRFLFDCFPDGDALEPDRASAACPTPIVPATLDATRPNEEPAGELAASRPLLRGAGLLLDGSPLRHLQPGSPVARM